MGDVVVHCHRGALGSGDRAVAGGRVEFTTGSAPWSWQVLVPAWMTLTGIVLALGGCAVFAQQIFVAILGRFEHDGLLDPPSRSNRRQRPSV